MDTRTKIIGRERAVELGRDEEVIAVTGYFDVLQAGLIRSLHGIPKDGAVLIAVVVDPPTPLLSARARAELAASLEVVDYVVPVADDATELLRAMHPLKSIREELGDEGRTAELIQHVQQKYRS